MGIVLSYFKNFQIHSNQIANMRKSKQLKPTNEETLASLKFLNSFISLIFVKMMRKMEAAHYKFERIFTKTVS